MILGKDEASYCTWEVSSSFAVATRLEPHQDAEKNVHSKAAVHQKVSKSKEEKKCCANWEDPAKIEYCWVSTSCLEWGQSSKTRDYSTVDDDQCGSATDCVAG